MASVPIINSATPAASVCALLGPTYNRLARTPGDTSGPFPPSYRTSEYGTFCTDAPAIGDPDGPTARTRSARTGNTTFNSRTPLTSTAAFTDRYPADEPSARRGFPATDNVYDPAATTSEYRPSPSARVVVEPNATSAPGTNRPAESRTVPDTTAESLETSCRSRRRSLSIFSLVTSVEP